MTMRSRTLFFAALCLAGAASAASAQTAANPISDSARQSWEGVKKNVKESAELMPEANYSFKPTAEVRSFGAILSHLAGANYVFCAAAKGEKTPHAEDEFEKSATTRTAIIAALNGSLAYCDAVFASATDRSLSAAVEMPFGMPRSAQASALVMEIGHMNEHYGNLVTYYRLKGLVPPSSRK
jgi:uncharacterized damage-inducible protein DinB